MCKWEDWFQDNKWFIEGYKNSQKWGWDYNPDPCTPTASLTQHYKSINSQGFWRHLPTSHLHLTSPIHGRTKFLASIYIENLGWGTKDQQGQRGDGWVPAGRMMEARAQGHDQERSRQVRNMCGTSQSHRQLGLYLCPLAGTMYMCTPISRNVNTLMFI